MKVSLKRLIRDEKGRALVVSLILLGTGGLILAPLLSLMSAGLLAGQVYEIKTDELYAADAGVEDAIWKIQQGDVPVCPGNPTLSYNITDPINDKSVAVTITYKPYDPGIAYLIESTATGNGSATKIEAYLTANITYNDYSGILDHIVTCQGEADIAKKVTLVYPEGCGPAEYYSDPWPTPEEIAQFYWQDVENVTAYGSGTINLNGVDMTKGPLYRDGTLEIKNSSNTPATLTLTGTIYITGDTLIGQNGKDFTLNLNGYTVFVSSTTAGAQKALIVGGKCTIEGPGVIIAVGDIYFAPKAQAGGEEKPVFVMSVLGTNLMQPSGTFYGALAGSVEVEIKQGTNPIITYPIGGLGDLNFPNLLEAPRIYSIDSWEVNPV